MLAVTARALLQVKDRILIFMTVMSTLSSCLIVSPYQLYFSSALLRALRHIGILQRTIMIAGILLVGYSIIPHQAVGLGHCMTPGLVWVALSP